MTKVIATSDENFDAEVLKSDKPVIVDFWAEWCNPCKMIAPVLDEISTERETDLKVAKINIDENPETMTKYGVKGIPTLLLVKNGEVIGTKVGFVDKNAISDWVKASLNA